MDAQHALVGEWALAMTIIAVHEQQAAQQDDPVFPLPPPSRFFKGSIGFGMLGLLSIVAPELAAVFGLGLVLALAYNTFATPAAIAADEGATIGNIVGKALGSTPTK